MITLYTRPACGQCQATKRALTSMGADFEIIDISQNEEARQHLIELGYESAPVVQTDTDMWSGFRLDRIKAAL